MKYLPLEREEYLYLLLLLQQHQSDLRGDNDSHAKKMNASLLDRMKTTMPAAKLCVIHGDGPLDMEKDAECNVCEPETFAQLGAQVFNQRPVDHTCNPKRLESEYDLQCAACKTLDTQAKAYCPFERDSRSGELTAADMEVLYATGTPRPEKKE